MKSGIIKPFRQKYFLIPSVARLISALMVKVNFTFSRSLKDSHQSRKSSILASTPSSTIFVRLSMKIWVMS